MKKIRNMIYLILFMTSICRSNIYVSPGIQIGFNSNDGFFYGYQFSIGHSNKYLNDFFSTERFLIPSFCYGFKRIHKKYNEQYFDFQITSFSTSFILPVGLGFGKNFSRNKSDFRIKNYFWAYSNFTLDYNLEEKSYNISLIPVLPIPIFD